ncbi:MAG: hypothetical protein LUE14_12815 [Clostridiales bacterium]|nr:hypothetical protein [Clostridiales bacterium]
MSVRLSEDNDIIYQKKSEAFERLEAIRRELTDLDYAVELQKHREEKWPDWL